MNFKASKLQYLFDTFLSNCIKAVDKNNAMPSYKNQFTNTVLAIFIMLIKLIQYRGGFFSENRNWLKIDF